MSADLLQRIADLTARLDDASTDGDIARAAVERYQKERQVWAEKKKRWAAHETRLREQRDELLKALKLLLDDWERTSAGFPQHIEFRYAVRDRARAVIAAVETRADDPHEPEFYQQGQTGVEPAPSPEPDESSPAATPRSTT
jgi:hypothetical protein